MPGYVSVNPERCRLLANALRDAAAALPSNRQSITSAISGWDASWPGSKVEALASWLDGQYGPMLDRADLAQTAANQPVASAAGSPLPTKFTIPFDVTDQDKAAEGFQDARDLASQFATGNDEEKDRASTELANALEAHSDDPAWMQSFISAGGAAVIAQSNVTALGHHLPVSEDHQRVLASNAKGVAAATTMAQNGQIQVPADAFKALYEGDSVMATGAMMKFGPSGSAYGSQFLSDAGDAALQWRKDHQARPNYSPSSMNIGGYVPGGYVQDEGDWWTKYGVDVDYASVGRDDANRGIQQIRDYDPSLNILTRVGENPRASQLLLTGPEGADHARSLVDYTWATPPSDDDSAPAAAVIRSATTDREGPFAKDSAQAAANLFDATSYRASHPSKDNFGNYAVMPATLVKSLSAMGSAYVTDLAKSTVQTKDGSSQVVIDSLTGQPVVSTNTSVINGFLHLIDQDPSAAGSFQGSVNAQLQQAALLTSKFPDDPTTTGLLKQAGYLNGMTAIARSDAKYDAAAAADADNARDKSYVDAATGILAAVPGLAGAGDITKFLAASGKAIAGAGSAELFPTGAAGQASSEAQYTIDQDANDMRVFVAQGFASSGACPTPSGATFVHDGKIAPKNDQEQAAFDNWYANLPDTLDDLNDAKAGFFDAAGACAPNDDEFENPKS